LDSPSIFGEWFVEDGGMVFGEHIVGNSDTQTEGLSTVVG
jgi:hypothetical protein